MKFLFDMTHITILHTAETAQELLFDDDSWPAHMAHVRSVRIEGIDDSLFLGSRKDWHEMNLRRLYHWLKMDPPLSPTKMDDNAILSLRIRIRNFIAASLHLEPNTLPPLEPVLATVSAPPAPKPIRLPNASRGSVGPLIHRVATEMWEAAGSPKDIPAILTLRQTIMKTLNDEHKIKTSTSSNELGRWQKQILSL